jgi:hypothetical protein
MPFLLCPAHAKNRRRKIARIVDQTCRMRTPGKLDHDLKDPMLGFPLYIVQKVILWVESSNVREEEA